MASRFVVLPLSPHTFTMRPVVDSADRVYEMVVEHPNAGTSAVVDGRVRIVEIEGVEDSGKRQFLEEMELGDAAALLDRFDEADGGVETTIEVECPSCLGVQEVQLPFERGFFLPRTKATS